MTLLPGGVPDPHADRVPGVHPLRAQGGATRVGLRLIPHRHEEAVRRRATSDYALKRSRDSG